MKMWKIALQLLLIVILLVMIDGALKERDAMDERFIALDQNLNELTAKVEYNNQIINQLENNLSDTTKRLKESEEWLKEHEKFIEVFTND